MKADVEFMATGEFLTAALTGEIDHHTAALLRSKIDEQIDRRLPQKLILDFSGVGFMDSSGIGLILGRSKRMQAAGGPVSKYTSRTVDKGGNTMNSNKVKISFCSRSANEAFARGAVAAFVATMDPTVAELSDIKTAVSEAVTNCIVHAYRDTVGQIDLTAEIREDNKLILTITDKGVGIEDVERAMQPMYTTGSPEERAGLGFAVMKSFMDELKVRSKPGKGTRVTMTKYIRSR